VPQLTSTRVAGYRCFPKGRNGAQLFAQSRTLRIRQTVGLDLSIARSTSPLQPVAILPLSHFHKVSRAAGPKMTNRKEPNYFLFADEPSGILVMTSQKPVCGPRGSAEGLKDYFRIADQADKTWGHRRVGRQTVQNLSRRRGAIYCTFFLFFSSSDMFHSIE